MCALPNNWIKTGKKTGKAKKKQKQKKIDTGEIRTHAPEGTTSSSDYQSNHSNVTE